MCLFVKSGKKKADRDICCIKILDSKLRSVYMHYSYTLHKKEEMQAKYFREWWHFDSRPEIISEAFHSYKCDASYNWELEYDLKFNNFILVECIIPKGTYYYEGNHNAESLSGYASNAIIPIKILTKD